MKKTVSFTSFILILWLLTCPFNSSAQNYEKKTDKKVSASSIALSKQYSNSYFSIHYPSSWQVVQDENQATAKTTIAVQIMQKRTNDVDFCPNVNIIISGRKWSESTATLASQTAINNKKVVHSFKKVRISDTKISGYRGSLLEYTCPIDGYNLRGRQYIVKKPDNTTFIITATTDNKKDTEQVKVVKSILNSIVIK